MLQVRRILGDLRPGAEWVVLVKWPTYRPRFAANRAHGQFIPSALLRRRRTDTARAQHISQVVRYGLCLPHRTPRSASWSYRPGGFRLLMSARQNVLTIPASTKEWHTMG